MLEPTASGRRGTPEWRVCRHLIRLLMELDGSSIETFNDGGRLGFYSVNSHDQGPMNFLARLGVVDGGWVSWTLTEPDFDRCADILLESAPFDEVLSALVSTTIYNCLLPEVPEPFTLPRHESTTGAVLEELKSLMGALVELGYARRVIGQDGSDEIYSWTEWMASSMLANYARGWKTI